MGEVKIISCNVNGIRSATRKGFFDWVAQESPDILCLQEVRCFFKDWPQEACLPGYHIVTSEAIKPGYSGVAVLTKEEPNETFHRMGFLDEEGRYIELKYPQFSILNFYLPSGTSGDSRQVLKMQYLDRLGSMLNQRQQEPLILVGDFNIAHTQKDIKNWKTNQKTSGFLPEERAWMDFVFHDLGYKDSFRIHNSNDNEYSWWSQRANARANNVGWRIDYQILSAPLKSAVQNAWIYRDRIFSDHAPTVHQYRL